MAQLTDTLELTSILATAPGNDLIWEHFLEKLSQQLSCDSSAMLVTDLNKCENTHFLFSVNVPAEYQEKYENGLNQLDSFNYVISKNPKKIFSSQALDGINQEETNEFFKPLSGQKYRFGVSIPCNKNYALSLIISRKSVFTELELQQFREIIQAIIPFLEEALHEEQRYKINSQVQYLMGDHFDGYIIIDRELNILFSDPVYSSIISQLDCFIISGNQFNMKNPIIEQKLLTLIEKNKEAGSIHNPCQSCQITLIPISSLENLYKWECYKDGFILTFTHDKDKNPTLNRLSEIYQLTRCEAVCALHFMKTPSISDVAASTYRSQETVRNHIKHSMQKMDVHNQAELMKKLITIAAL